MTRYYFDWIDAKGGRVTDLEGMEFASLEAARADALHSLSASDLAGDAKRGAVHIEIFDSRRVHPICTVVLDAGGPNAPIGIIEVCFLKVRHGGAEPRDCSERLTRTDSESTLTPFSAHPQTILRSTQFFEFMGGLAGANTEGQVVHLPPALIQPVAADDVAGMLAQLAVRPAGSSRSPGTRVAIRL